MGNEESCGSKEVWFKSVELDCVGDHNVEEKVQRLVNATILERNIAECIKTLLDEFESVKSDRHLLLSKALELHARRSWVLIHIYQCVSTVHYCLAASIHAHQVHLVIKLT